MSLVCARGIWPEETSEVLIRSEVVGVAKVVNNWESEASPTLGCSIEISRDIYTKYSTLPSGISVYIVPKVGIFPEAGGRGKYSLPRVQYMPILHKEGF